MFCGFVSLGLFAKPTNLKSISKLKSYLQNKVKIKNIKSNYRSFLRETYPHRFIGSKGAVSAQKFIISDIKKNDIGKSGTLSVDEFSPEMDWAIRGYRTDFQTQIVGKYALNHPEFIKWSRFTENVTKVLNDLRHVKGKNIIWEKLGKTYPHKLLVLTANYDSIVHKEGTLEVKTTAETQGSDNNASGVIALLNLVKLLSNIELENSVRIVFTDFDQLGHLGTKAYISKYHKGSMVHKFKLKGIINLTMLGHDSKIFDKNKKTGNMKIYTRKNLSQIENSLVRFITSYGKKITQTVNFSLLNNDFSQGSSTLYWKEGLPAIVMTHDWENDPNPMKYSSNDFFETLNMKTFYNSFRYISGSVISWSLNLNR